MPWLDIAAGVGGGVLLVGVLLLLLDPGLVRALLSRQRTGWREE